MEPDREPTALEELENDPRSRRKFLSMAGVGAGGALALLVAACGGDDDDSGGSAGSTSTREEGRGRWRG